MPTVPYMRCTWSGVFGGASAPVEIWSFGVNAIAQLNATPANLGAAATAMRTAFVTHLAPLYRSDVVLTKARIAAVGSDGHVNKDDQGGYVQADNITPAPGSSTNTSVSTYPLQTALAVSLLTPRAGATGKGRFFLPWPSSIGLSADYRLAGSNADAVRDSVLAFLRAVRAGILPAGNSPLLVVSSKGYSSEVTGIRVGRAPDTMRSRRNRLLEQYSLGTL